MDLMKAAENEFEGADLQALRDYCVRMGLDYHANMNADTLRKKLTAALGDYREVSSGESEGLDVDSQRERVRTLAGYNLRSTGHWDGKRRIVQLHRSMSHDNTTRPQFFAWGRLHVYVPFNVPCAIPYPIYNILKNTTGKKLDRKRRVDDEGRIRFEEVWSSTERFMYSDMGDDPETADRPASELERIKMLYGLTDGFKGYGERQFRSMCERLHLRTRPDWTEEDYREAVFHRCGFGEKGVDLNMPEEAVA